MAKNVKAIDKRTLFLKKSILLYFILLVLFFSLFFVVHAIAMTLITIPDDVKINNKTIFLQDIARIKGDDHELVKRINNVELGHSPSPGKSKTIDRNYIVLRLKKEGIDSSNYKLSSNEKITLRRSSKLLPKVELEKELKNRLYQYLGSQRNKMVIEEILGLEDVVIPDGREDYNLEIRRNMSKYGRLVGYLKINVDDEIYKKLWIQVKVAFKIKVGKANIDITKGDLIKEGDIVFEEVLLNDMSRDYIFETKFVNGLEATRNLKKGTILHDGNFAKPVLVKKGDEVIITVNINSLKITASGTAIQKGGLGDVIKVLNESANKTLMGKITSKGRVVVD